MFRKIKQHPHFFGFLFLALVSLILFFLLTSPAFSVTKRIDTHEHIESLEKAHELVESMDRKGISQAVLVPSPIETITLNGNQTFTRYQENIDEIIRIHEAYPDRFIPFCTVSPIDPDALEIFEDCVRRGGRGLKLYNGHSFYYESFGVTLDSPRMRPLYAFAERNSVPLLFHVNIKKYGEELERVLVEFPDLRVSIPHFMVSSIQINEVKRMLDKYPNLYTDMSFGHDPFLAAGFRRINNKIEKYQTFFEEYPDRVLFGADMVLTHQERKDRTYVDTILQCYRDIIEKKRYKCSLVNEHYRQIAESNASQYENCRPKSGNFCKSKKEKSDSFGRWFEETKVLNGLNLNAEQQRLIYEENPERWLGMPTYNPAN